MSISRRPSEFLPGNHLRESAHTDLSYNHLDHAHCVARFSNADNPIYGIFNTYEPGPGLELLWIKVEGGADLFDRFELSVIRRAVDSIRAAAKLKKRFNHRLGQARQREQDFPRR